MVLAGGYDQNQGGMGAFQEWPQVTMQTSLSVCVLLMCFICWSLGMGTIETVCFVNFLNRFFHWLSH